MAKTKIKLDFLAYSKILNIGVFYPNCIQEATRCMIALNNNHKASNADMLTTFYYLDRSTKDELHITVDYTGIDENDYPKFEDAVEAAYPERDDHKRLRRRHVINKDRLR